MDLVKKKYDRILFLDFDGTITMEDTLEGCMKRQVDSAYYQEKAEEMLAGKLTLADVVHLGFSQIPSSKLPELLDYVKSVPIRKGFQELLDAMKEAEIPVVVISGGLKPYVEARLAPYREKLMAVHSVELDASGEYMRLVSPYEGNGEILQKTLIMAEYDYLHGICAGDSYTDINMAKKAETVFARDRLAKILEKQGLPYIPWEDFYEVRDSILSSK